MLQKLSYVSGKIETKNGECFAEGRVVDCPNRTFMGLGGDKTQSGIKLDILPSNFIPDTRNDSIAYGSFIAIIILFVMLWSFRIKIFGKTLIEYLKPIWYLIILCLLIVAWQYLVGEKSGSRLLLQISQWLWELAVAVSAYVLIRKYEDFNFGNVIFLGILFSFIIHGSKVIIRYIFYDRSLLYILDRFLYGSLLVMIIVVGLGTAFLFTRKKEQPPEHTP